MSDDSVVEGLHRASPQLRDQWMSESVARVVAQASRESKRMADVQNKDFSLVIEQLRSSEGTARDPRTAELLINRYVFAWDLYDDPLLYWVPYIHSGI